MPGWCILASPCGPRLGAGLNSHRLCFTVGFVCFAPAAQADHTKRLRDSFSVSARSSQHHALTSRTRAPSTLSMKMRGLLAGRWINFSSWALSSGNAFVDRHALQLTDAMLHREFDREQVSCAANSYDANEGAAHLAYCACFLGAAMHGKVCSSHTKA